MDPHDNISAKKERNAKIRRDKRKNTYSKTNAADPPVPEPSENAASTPQPQRVNNRQRNESSAKTTATSEEIGKVADNLDKSKEVKENMIIDHSNLKRETEEIVKLTKKFSKREVTSNWHRYATDENVSFVEHQQEEGPADFTDLLKVSMSRGSHLVLKEEQEWSSAVPKGHWALDLHQLSFSLACIPTYKRLRIPLDKLTEEDIQRYDCLAEEAKKYYNACQESDLKEDVGYREKPFNILDVERSTKSLINMDLGLDTNVNKISVSNTVNDSLENSDSHVLNEVKLNAEEDISLEHKKELGLPKIKDMFNNKTLDTDNKTKSSDLLLDQTEKHNKPSFEPPLQEKLENNNLFTTPQSLDDNHPDENKVNQIKSPTPSLVELAYSESSNKFKSIENSETDSINNYEIKEKRERRRNNRKSSVTDKSDCKAVEIEEIKLEDEDDLDFLLSLKKPISSEKKNESKPADLKDSSFIPGPTVAPTTTPIQQTDLDDWLDSVLED